MQGPLRRVRLGAFGPGINLGDVENRARAVHALGEQGFQVVEVHDARRLETPGLEARGHRPQFQDGQIQQHEFDPVAGQNAHPVARAQAQRLQAPGHARRLAVQFRQRPGAHGAVLPKPDDMLLVIASAQRDGVDQINVLAARRLRHHLAHDRPSSAASARRSGVKKRCSAKFKDVPGGDSSTLSGQTSTRSMPKARPKRWAKRGINGPAA